MEYPVFMYWREALPIMADHHRRFEGGKATATCEKCGAKWPCDANLLGQLLAETTEKLVVADHMAYNRRQGG